MLYVGFMCVYGKKYIWYYYQLPSLYFLTPTEVGKL